MIIVYNNLIEMRFSYAVDEYEKQFKMQVEDLERVKNEYSTAKRHLANLEIAFSDVHQ